MTGWPGRPATEIAAAVRAGEATAGQVVAAHLDRIARLNAELGAFVRVRAAEAAAEADAVDKRADRTELLLAGVPAASVPLPGAELPGAVQLVAAPGREQVLLALAAQLERARGWPRHAPAYARSLLSRACNHGLPRRVRAAA